MFAASKSGSFEASDAQFNYVTMLLHGDGTNGAQNNTFVDSSTNNFTITRNGNTTQGTFTPYGSNWSNYGSGSGNYLTIANDAAFQFGSGAFTVECWFFAASTSSSQGIVGKWADGQPDSNAAWDIDIEGGNIRAILASGGTVTSWTGTALTANTWNHVALVRNGSNTVSLFLNGSRVATQTYSSTINNGANNVYVSSAYANNRVFTGYISNVRIVKGTAVYDPTLTTYTVPTTPLTAISGTSLLTCQSNRFIDNSSNAFAVTPTGSPSVQRFSPFSPTTAYSTSVIGGSAYFDGTGDYLQTPSSSAFNFSATDCTLEFWYYGAGSGGLVFEFGSSAPDTAAMQCEFSSGTLTFKPIGASSSFFAIQKDAWNYIAAVKTGTTYYLYINGTRNTSSTGTAASSGQIINIGARNGGSVAPITGYLSDFRVSNTARYTAATMTVPTAPLTAITNTSLLLSYTNAGILDNAMMNDLETVGNAQISTSVKKYGTGSIAFDGSGDYLSTLPTRQLDFGTGNFTFEMWLNLNTVSAVQVFVSFGYEGSTQRSFVLYLTSSNVLQFAYSTNGSNNTDTSLGASGITTGTWNHLAVVRNGTTITLYRNGTAYGTTITIGSSAINYTPGAFRIGTDATNYTNGYIDDLRISKGLARYTANFTAPTTAFADKG